MTAPLPDRWDDEPWPLDDPTPAPSLRPTTWSDTHDQPPQVADLADEAWQYAIDHGVSMERALAELQRRAALPKIRFHTGGIVKCSRSHPVTYDQLRHLIEQDLLAWQPSADQIKRLLDPGNGA